MFSLGLEAYQQAVRDRVTSNVIIDKEKSVKSPASSGPVEDTSQKNPVIKAIADQIVQDAEDHVQENPSIIENQGTMFDDDQLTQCQDKDKPAIIKMFENYRAEDMT